MGRSIDLFMALAAGALLAVMIDFNSLLAKHSTPLYASWLPHGIGAMVALFFIAGFSHVLRKRNKEIQIHREKAPLWAYLGGIPGAFTVVLAAITVNSSLGLSSSLALMLAGQVFFGILSDQFGLFGLPKRTIKLTDIFVILLVLTGSVILIFFG